MEYFGSYNVAKLIGESARRGDEDRKNVLSRQDAKALAYRLWPNAGECVRYDWRGLINGFVDGYFEVDVSGW